MRSIASKLRRQAAVWAVLSTTAAAGLMAEPAVADAPFSLSVMAARPSDEAPHRLVEVRDGDWLFDGDQFRLYIEPTESMRISVKLLSDNGPDFDLLTDQAAEPGRRVVLPDWVEWYTLDENQGVETVRIVAQPTDGGPAITVDHQIRHHGRDVLEAVGLPLSTPVASTPAAPDSSVATRGGHRPPPQASSAPTPDEVARYERLLGSSGLNKPEQITRGSTEISLYQMAAPGVVLIVTGDSIGSGSVISPDGYILTNWHVVEDNRRGEVEVIFKPGRGQTLQGAEIHKARIVHKDPTRDLALIKLTNPPADLTIIPIGAMEDIEVGSDVHAIGHPEGETWTYTKGFVSQIRPNYKWEVGDGLSHLAMVIQTQTPITFGNSGGPLLTSDGHMVGVNSFISGDSNSLNYAVSISDVTAFLAGSPMRPPMVAQVPDQGSAQPPAPQPSGDDEGKHIDQQQKVQEQGAGDDEILMAEQETGSADGACEVSYGEVRAYAAFRLAPIDSDCNGVDDVFGIDVDADDLVDFFYADTDEDGRIDAKLYDEGEGDAVGRLVWILFDENLKATMLGYDDDDDGEIDRLIPI